MKHLYGIFKYITRNFLTQLAYFTLFIGIVENTKACIWLFHQPEVPDEIKKYTLDK